MKNSYKKRICKASLRGLCFAVALGSASTMYTSAIKSINPEKYSIDVDLKLFGSSMGFCFGGYNDNQTYMWQLNGSDPTIFKLRKHIRQNGNWWTDNKDITSVIPLEKREDTHHMRLDINKDTIICAIDAVPVDTMIDANMLKGKWGRIGLRYSSVVTDLEGGSMDNLVIKDDKGAVLYQNDFTGVTVDGVTTIPDFPDMDVVDGAVVNKAGKEFSWQTGVWKKKYTLDVDFACTSIATGICFNAIDDQNTLMWQYNTENVDGAPSVRLRPHTKFGGSYASRDIVITDVVPVEKAFDEHHMKIEVDGAIIITYIDGTRVDSTTVEAFDMGNVGFRNTGNETGAFDNLMVKDGNGKILYQNDFNNDIPFNFPLFTTIDGKLYPQEGSPEFGFVEEVPEQLMTNVIKNASLKKDDAITVNLFSHTENDFVNLPIHYRIDNGEIVTETVSSLLAYNKLDYTFTKKFAGSPNAKVTLSVWSTTNDSISVELDNTPVVVALNKNSANGFNIYKKGASIVVMNDSKDATTVEIFNIAGSLAKTVKFNGSEGTISMSDLASGLYIVKATTGNITKTQKITK